MTIIKILARWLLAAASAVIIAVLFIQGSRFGVSLSDTFCTEQNMIGGACVEPWHTGLVEAAIYIAVVLCTVCLTIIPSAFAPALRRTVSVVGSLMCLAGLLAFYNLTKWPELFPPMAVSILCGAIALFWVWPRRSTNAD